VESGIRFVFYLQDADGGIVEAPVTSSNFPMACFMTEKTYICIKSGQVEDKLIALACVVDYWLGSISSAYVEKHPQFPNSLSFGQIKIPMGKPRTRSSSWLTP